MRTGRPRIGGAQHQVGFRLPVRLVEDLNVAAADAGRTLSEEVRARLEASFMVTQEWPRSRRGHEQRDGSRPVIR